jgi:acetolactate synthase regulatory subunit
MMAAIPVPADVTTPSASLGGIGVVNVEGAGLSRATLAGMEATESPVLIDVWTVDPSREPELLDRILEITRDLLVDHPGFVSAQVYESVDHSAVTIRITMRTVKDRQALTDSADVHSALRELRAIAHSDVRLFRLVESFGEPA